MIFNNINNKKIIVKFHELYLYDENYPIKYLFFVPSQSITKKYLLEINYDDFHKFIQDCFDLGFPKKYSKFDFESKIIQLIESYKIYTDNESQIIINKKIGNLLLNHLSFIKFDYLKNLYKYFNSVHYIDQNKEHIKHSQIRYLIIMFTNLLDLIIYESDNKFNKSKPSIYKSEPINDLDFIFDYYLD